MKLNEKQLRQIINEELDTSSWQGELSDEQKEKVMSVLKGLRNHINEMTDLLSITDSDVIHFVEVTKRRLDKLTAVAHGLNAR